MNCIKCYREIPEGSRFCPHCGAQQPDASGAETTNAQPDPQADMNNTNTQPDTQADTNTNTQDEGHPYVQPDTRNYYQTPPVYQSSYEPKKEINWVPYLVLSIISLVCCCPPFGIVGIVYAAKINNAMNTGDYTEAERCARLAKIWIIVAFVVGFFAQLIFGVLTYFGIMGSYYYYY